MSVREAALTNQARSAVGAELRLPLGARSALLADGSASRAHHGERLLRVPRLERLVVQVRDLSRLAIELQLAQRIDGVALPWLRTAPTRSRVPLCHRNIRPKEGIENEAER